MPTLRFSLCILVLVLLPLTIVQAQQNGVTDDRIVLGGVMDLEGDARGLGLNMKAGLEAAFRDRPVNGRTVELIARNDFYTPANAAEQTRALIDRGIFAMIGNVGTPTALVTLPIMAEHGVPAIGFFTGAGILRPGVGDVVNFRASYIQEVSTVVDAALEGGLLPQEVCGFVQNDSYGMAGVAGFIDSLQRRTDAAEELEILEMIVAQTGEEPTRNFLGPIGVYARNALSVREGYESLKTWEAVSGHACRLVFTVGAYAPISRFIAYARERGEDWRISAVSFTGAASLLAELINHNADQGVIMTQVVPPLNSTLPIIEQARADLGTDLNFVSLEGYIAGRMFLTIAEATPEPLTRDNFLSTLRGNRFDLDGLDIDFRTSNQASDLVTITLIQEGAFQVIGLAELRQMFQ